VSSCGHSKAALALRQKAILLNRINVIWVVQSPSAKIFRLTRRANQWLNFRRPVPSEGRFANVTDVRRDAVDAMATQDGRRRRGRRSRVVLTPRRWRQVSRGHSRAGDGGKRARSPGRARRKPLKPLRRECRVNRCDRGDYARVLFLFCTRGCGRGGRPAFPAPSDFSRAGRSQQNSRQHAARSRSYDCK
jgi:hypothetical protein